MSLFLSTYVNKIDRKGRVSVPAPFRAALSGESASTLVLFRSSHHACLEGFGWARMDELAARLEHYDLFSPAQDDLATTLFGDAVPLNIDSDGRIVLPADLLAHAGLDDNAAFVGMGRKFQLWSPAALEARRKDARKNVKEQGLTLPRTDGGAA